MEIKPLTLPDYEDASKLQPPDWQDIRPNLWLYLHSDFCFPVKAIIDNKFIGIGAAILHQDTAWLAQIIVSPEYRSKGIGAIITRYLIDLVKPFNVKSILLVATSLGKPLYTKLGFIPELEYVFYKRPSTIPYVSEICVDYSNKYKGQVLELDKKISGEGRAKILELHLEQSKLFLQDDEVAGFYLPKLGEGMIAAETEEAGLELLRLKHDQRNLTVIPESNHAARNLLVENGFAEYRRGTRMYLGEYIPWQPEKLFSRVGGNIG